MKTKITFKQESKTSVNILQNGIKVGHFFSEGKDGFLPYPHDDTKNYCKNSIQICGFDGQSETWACGVYHGRKDVVVNFLNYKDKYIVEQYQEYKRYVKEFLDSGISITKLNNFNDWFHHSGHPSIDRLVATEQKEEIEERDRKENGRKKNKQT